MKYYNSNLKIKQFKRCKVCRTDFKMHKTTDKYCSPKCQSKDKRDRKDYSGLVSKLQELINTLVRILDKGQNCFTTNTKPCWETAGHVISVQSNPQLRYNLFNIYLQDAESNSENCDLNNKVGLIIMFGPGLYKYIQSLRSKYKTLDLMEYEFLQKIQIVKECIKEAKSLPKLTTEQRIQFREYFQKKIGIYN